MDTNLIPLDIEKLVYGGDGLARLPEDQKGRRMAVFVPFTLPGEQVEAANLQTKGGMARAELHSIRKASPQRVPAPCPYFGTCGGCHLQHGSYESQLEAKRAILRETFDRARLDVPIEIQTLAADPWNYRNRIRVHVRTTPAWQVGYLERRSHRFLAVATCPISVPLLQRAIATLAQPALASLAPATLAEIEIFCNHDSSQMTLTAFLNAGPETQRNFAATFHQWIAALQDALPQLRGATALTRDAESYPGQSLATVGDPHLIYRVGDCDYRVSAGSFFQVNQHLLPQLAALITSSVPGQSESILDLYAGVGLFSLPLARSGAAVTAVESAPASSDNLAANLLSSPGTIAVRSTTERFLSRLKRSPDAIIVDPPRAGLGAEATQHLVRIAAPTLLYLSCDPATLARDLQPLLRSGYAAEQVTMIDLFPQTFHIEALVVLRRKH